MDVAAFKALRAAARKVTETVDGIEFTLVLPSAHGMRAAFEEGRGPTGIQQARISRALLEESVVGWKGLTTRHLLPDAPLEEIPFSAETLEMLLDDRQDIADDLAGRVFERADKRQKEIEAATKNS